MKLGRPKIDSATERKGAKAACERCGYLEGGEVARDWDWHGAAHLLDLAEDWQQHGREVFKRVRRESPAAYLKVCAMLVPREMKLEHSGGVKAMTDEEIERSIELIKAMIAERDAGANAKVIEGEAEVIPGLPAPGSGGTKMPKV
ncbi:MAG TPA: hypothetical protein VKG24_22235 [Pseudolabrys sp.]|nr:hypothetical protein [Pseudolabrys sp.]